MQSMSLCNVVYRPDRGYTASIPGINAFGDGDSKEEAALALREALRSYMQVFGNER